MAAVEILVAGRAPSDSGSNCVHETHRDRRSPLLLGLSLKLGGDLQCFNSLVDFGMRLPNWFKGGEDGDVREFTVQHWDESQ
jgi:hypothetical protein